MFTWERLRRVSKSVANPADVVRLSEYLQRGGPNPDPIEAGHANCDEIVNTTDLVYLVNYLQKGGDPPGC
jgi:hypothetical protein